jgi:ProP effector
MNTLNRVNRSWQPWELIPILAGFWPSTFTVDEHRRRPIKIGILHDLLGKTAGVISSAEIKRTLRHYTSSTSYLRACSAGADRVDLNGNVVGSVTQQEAAAAAAKLARIPKRSLARKVGDGAGGVAPVEPSGLRDAITGQSPLPVVAS